MKNSASNGVLGYIGDEILPIYIRIIINHYKDPYKPTSIMESNKFFFHFSWLTWKLSRNFPLFFSFKGPNGSPPMPNTPEAENGCFT